jgi:hypothetical protein
MSNIPRELQRKIVSYYDRFIITRLPIVAGVVVDNVVVVVIELDMVVKFIVIVALVAGSVNSTVVSEIFELISQY